MCVRFSVGNILYCYSFRHPAPFVWHFLVTCYCIVLHTAARRRELRGHFKPWRQWPHYTNMKIEIKCGMKLTCFRNGGDGFEALPMGRECD